MGERRWLCRDCLREWPYDAVTTGRCLNCGSPRLIDAPFDAELVIAHIDCDAFYAAVEKRDNPSLRDKPLIVGGGGRRGVVSTCCYIARTFGVRSAMPMFRAMALCPHAVVVPPNMSKYSQVGRQIRDLMQTLTPLVEPLSIDEAFLDLSGCEGVHGADSALTLARFARSVETTIGVTVSIGLSYCKFLAKIASDLDKPRGFSLIARHEARAVLAPMPIERIWGVGKVAQARLNREGLRSIGDLQALDEKAVATRLGGDGWRLWRLAQGLDDRRVTPDRETKGISAETTFENNISDRESLTRTLLALSERVAARLRKQGLTAGGVTLKLRAGDFKLRTRSRSGLRPTQFATHIFATARALLDAQETGVAYRLIGVAAADLKPAADALEADLIDGDKENARESAIDALRDRFGSSAIVRGLAFVPDGHARKR
jgi:DNA polymerase-4